MIQNNLLVSSYTEWTNNDNNKDRKQFVKIIQRVLMSTSRTFATNLKKKNQQVLTVCIALHHILMKHQRDDQR